MNRKIFNQESGKEIEDGDNFNNILKSYIQSQITVIRSLSNEAIDYSTPETVHDMRVAFRRIVSVTTIFSAYIEEKWLKSYAPFLRKTLRILGKQRDLDILNYNVRNISKEINAGIKLKSFNSVLKQMTKKQQENIAKYLNGRYYKSLLDDIGNSLDHTCPPVTFSNSHIKTLFVNKCLSQVYAYSAWIDSSFIYESELHNLRLAFKDLRYVMHYFNEDSLENMCKKIQDVLGEIHDHNLLVEMIKKLSKKLPKSKEPEIQLLNEIVRNAEMKIDSLYKDFQVIWADFPKRVVF